MQRGGHEGSETNVQNAENVDGSAQAARFDSLRISNYATGIDDDNESSDKNATVSFALIRLYFRSVRWMPPSSTEQETSSEQQQPAQGYLTDVARIAPSSTAVRLIL
ncbi:unnamed protein product [Anisakis simplex]|uniref:Uncharacterized protein n=1 Tax=Anisakis simplex TaxID=6269 RepID=A0A0M3JBV2_ANISI|nr:unnamed protein product [Anisakis simplex]